MKALFISALFLFAASAVSEAKVHAANTDSGASARRDPEDFRVTSVPGHGPLPSKNYAGYLPLPTGGNVGRQAYFYLIESENKPESDPIFLWLNGGPGCSSMLGMYTELGPFTFVNGGKLELNPFRWVRNATMVFLDAPSGVGFSIDPELGKTTWTDDMAAENNYAFLKEFFNTFPKFRNVNLHLAGESYAGHYVPQLAEKIFDGDDAGIKAQMKGWMVGNPCTGEIGCANADPTLNPYMQYHGMLPMNSEIRTREGSYDPYDILAPTCVQKQELAMSRAFTAGTPHLAKARERLFGVKDGEEKQKALVGELPPPPGRYDACAMDEMEVFINKPEVKAAIHANASIRYESCSSKIRYPINRNGVVPIYEKLMAKTNWDILVFSGLEDSIVNPIQTQTVIDKMGMPLDKSKNYYAAWYYPDLYTEGATQLGGYYLQYERMAWAGVRGAGHMVPQSTPHAGYELFLSYITTGKPGRLGN